MFGYLPRGTDPEKGPKGDKGEQGKQGFGVSGRPGPPGAPGADGTDGTDGTDGARGSLWFSGTGPPGVIPGQQDGDLYLDTTEDDAYQLIAGVWTFVGDFTGTAGPQGPAGPAGADGPPGPLNRTFAYFIA